MKTRLQKYCDEARKLLSFPVQEETTDGDEVLAEELTECLNIIYVYNCDWVNFLKHLGTERKAGKEKEYNHMAKGAEGFTE